MIERLPVPVWSRLIDFLGFNDFYQLRKLNRYFKNRIDNEVCVTYKHLQGKININISNYLNYPVMYPKLLQTEEDKEYFSIENIGMTYTKFLVNYLKLLMLIISLLITCVELDFINLTIKI